MSGIIVVKHGVEGSMPLPWTGTDNASQGPAGVQSVARRLKRNLYLP